MNPDDLRRALAMVDAAGEEALNAAGPEEAINALTRAYIDLLGDREAHLKPDALKATIKRVTPMQVLVITLFFRPTGRARRSDLDSFS